MEREEMPAKRNSELRCRLQEITKGSEGVMLPGELAQEIAQLASTHPHSIERVLENETGGYNCFAHAFELLKSRAFKLIAGTDYDASWGIFFAGPAFARWLIQNRALVRITDGEARSGDVVIYLDDEGTVQHAGKIVSKGKRIKSKWGGTLLLQHELWEVPEGYGNTATFHQRISTATAERAFLKFCRSRDRFEEFVDKFDLRDLF